MKLCLNHISEGEGTDSNISRHVDQRPYEFKKAFFLLVNQWQSIGLLRFLFLLGQKLLQVKTNREHLQAITEGITISPPRVDEVVTKRLRYGINLLKTGIQLQFSANVTLKAQSLADYLER